MSQCLMTSFSACFRNRTASVSVLDIIMKGHGHDCCNFTTNLLIINRTDAVLSTTFQLEELHGFVPYDPGLAVIASHKDRSLMYSFLKRCPVLKIKGLQP